MKSRVRLVVISNLYPLPWEPERATFNRQQFALLESEFELSILVPVSFIAWFKHFRQITQTNSIRYVPYFFLPKLGRRFYAVWMFCSILLHSGLWLARRQPDIMLASWAFPDAVATSWLAKLFRCQFFFKVHGSDIHLHGAEKPRARQIIAAAKRAKGIISVSADLKAHMLELGIASEKIQVVYNGVNHALFGQQTTREITCPYILFVGNLKKDKGVMELMQAFHVISTQFTDHVLVVAGRGEMQEAMQQYAKVNNISHRVMLLGSIAHGKLPGLMQHADLVALPSYHEGVPNVLLESMAAGTPVVATAVGGIPEVVLQDVSGLLVASPEPVALAQTLSKALLQQWDRQAICQHAAQFNWDENKARLMQLLS